MEKKIENEMETGSVYIYIHILGFRGRLECRADTLRPFVISRVGSRKACSGSSGNLQFRFPTRSGGREKLAERYHKQRPPDVTPKDYEPNFQC